MTPLDLIVRRVGVLNRPGLWDVAICSGATAAIGPDVESSMGRLNARTEHTRLESLNP